eukprot:scaffold20802_cov115-Isochrysis_galbana.AAC.2
MGSRITRGPKREQRFRDAKVTLGAALGARPWMPAGDWPAGPRAGAGRDADRRRACCVPGIAAAGARVDEPQRLQRDCEEAANNYPSPEGCGTATYCWDVVSAAGSTVPLPDIWQTTACGGHAGTTVRLGRGVPRRPEGI